MHCHLSNILYLSFRLLYRPSVFLWYSNLIQSSGFIFWKLNSIQACILSVTFELAPISETWCFPVFFYVCDFVDMLLSSSIFIHRRGWRRGVFNYIEGRTCSLLMPKSLSNICCIFVDRVMNMAIVSCQVHIWQGPESSFWPIDSP